MKAIIMFGKFLFVSLLFVSLSSPAQGVDATDPVVMGTYPAGSFSFTDSRGNAGYRDDYHTPDSPYLGQPGEDIYYRFTLLGSAEVSIATCAADFDTYIHLLHNDGRPLEHNDDDGPLCAGSRASIKTTLTAGTYYIVVEGYDTASGTIVTLVNLLVQAPAVDVAVTQDTLNFVKVWEALAPELNGNLLAGKSLREVRQTTSYFDGLGRPVQTVVKQGSLVTATGRATDLVSPVVYDAYGRQPDQYLPYAATGSDGRFAANAPDSQNSFYRSALSPVFGQGEQAFFFRTVQEPSPLGRVTRTLAAGNSWVGSDRGVAFSYRCNSSTDSVRRWQVTEDPGGPGTYHSPSTYLPGSLLKKVTTDEGGSQVVEYQDKQGKVLLKKVQETAAASEGHHGWLCTYYIYDDLERLRAVLQPLAVQAMEAGRSWILEEVTLQELCFRYQYDARGRMILKKVPGAGAVYMVYDDRDRLVMTQDATLRKPGGEQWLVTVYDALNRPLQTGLWGNDQGLAYHLGQAANTDHYPAAMPEWELLTQTHYDDYRELPAGLQNKLLGGYAGSLALAASSREYAEPVVASSRTKGMVTWSTSKVLGSTSYLSTGTLYDEKGRVLQVQTTNYTGGTDISTLQYDFAGKILRQHLEHHKWGGQPVTLATRNSYDDLGRISGIEKNINNTGWKKISDLAYDALGQLVTKKLAPDFNHHQGLETLTYEYNIRGWLLGINRSYLRGKNSSGYQSRFFGFELGYDQPGTVGNTSFASPQYSGNIAGILWKSSGDAVRRKYDFTYDLLHRFGRADFTQNTDPADGGVGAYTTSGANYSVHGLLANNHSLMTYDANGNILSMVQHGLRGTSPDAVIDALRYRYYPHSNKLQQVQDDHNDNSSLLGDFKYDPAGKTSADYGYDNNGNLVTDLNKHLSGLTGTDLDEGGAISYNHLNLPSLIKVAGKGTIEYVYDATGNKLTKTVHETGRPDKTTRYMAAGIVYENDSLQFLAQEEGRIRPLRDHSGLVTGYAFDFFLKDHLGNVRMVLTDEQASDAYPVAALEAATLDSEKMFYRIPEASIVHKATVPGYPQQDDYTAPNDYVQRLNGNGQKVGTSIVLKVMSGDKVNIRASSWYRQSAVAAGNSPDLVADIVASLVQGIGGLPGAKTGTLTPGQQQALSPAIASFLDQQHSGSVAGKPRASLNWLLLDEQLNPVITADGNNSGSEPVGEDQQLTLHQVTERPITTNGYLYIYLSNESGTDVFFDNLQVTHLRGPLLEETHYYPFGLEMSGISSKAAGRMENNKKYNGIEFDNDLDLNTYEAFYRNLDPQIGRWWQIDPKVDEGYESISPYASMYDDPIRYSDPLGDEADEEYGGPGGPLIGGPIIVTPGSPVDRAIKTVANGIAETGRKLLISAGGLLNGALNTLSAGLLPKDPAKYFGTSGLTTDEQELYNTSADLGQAAALVTPMVEAGLGLELATVNGPKVSLPRAPFLRASDRMNSNSSEGSNTNASQNQPKQSKVERSTKTESIGNGKFTKTTDVKPGKGPGQSRAEYVRYKNQTGKVIRTQKFTYDRANRFQHKKPLRGGPEGRPQNE